MSFAERFAGPFSLTLWLFLWHLLQGKGDFSFRFSLPLSFTRILDRMWMNWYWRIMKDHLDDYLSNVNGFLPIGRFPEDVLMPKSAFWCPSQSNLVDLIRVSGSWSPYETDLGRKFWEKIFFKVQERFWKEFLTRLQK